MFSRLGGLFDYRECFTQDARICARWAQEKAPTYVNALSPAYSVFSIRARNFSQASRSPYLTIRAILWIMSHSSSKARICLCFLCAWLVFTEPFGLPAPSRFPPQLMPAQRFLPTCKLLSPTFPATPSHRPFPQLPREAFHSMPFYTNQCQP